MKLSIAAELVYTFAEATQVIACLEASHTADQTVLSESLDVQPPVQLLRDSSASGDRRIRAALSGQTTIRYEAVVENNLRQLPAALRSPACLVRTSKRGAPVPPAEPFLPVRQIYALRRARIPDLERWGGPDDGYTRMD